MLISKTKKNKNKKQMQNKIEVFDMRIFAFLLTCLGGFNWLMIGALQYDFIAGVFGTQANVFSRIIYFLIGIASIYILAVTVFAKGKLKLFGYKKKKEPKREEVEDF